MMHGGGDKVRERLEEEGRLLGAQLNLVRASRWVRLGRQIGLGPDLP